MDNSQELSELLRQALRFRQRVMANDAAAIKRLIEAYVAIGARLKDKIDALVAEIGALNPTQGQLVRMVRYKSLLEQIGKELSDYQVLLQFEVNQAIDFGVGAGSEHAKRLVELVARQARIQVSFHNLPKEALIQVLGLLDESGPLYRRLQQLAPQTVESVAKKIAEGVGLGYNPRKIARLINNELGQGLTTAMRTTRTAQLYAYREATRANYIANSDIVRGWYWSAQLDDRTCMSCIAQHGTFHPLNEPLNDHYNGRCAPLPAVLTLPNPIEQSGEQWFKQQSEEVQKRMMGDARWEAWKAGKFSFDKLSGQHEDTVYGQMRVERSLSELLKLQ